MGLDVGRWFKYAQAKLDAAVRSGNDELDQLEAQREAELAERPWLASDGQSPTLDEARARIAWEAEQAQQGAAPPTPSAAAPTAPAGPAAVDEPGAPAPPAARPAPSSGTEAEVAEAKLVLKQREVEARERLEAIRAELGVDPPAPGSP